MKCKITVGDVDLAYEQVGKGPNIVLLLSGAIGSSRTDFAHQLDHWKDSEIFTVIAVDARGYGRSRPPDRIFTSRFYHQDAEDAILFMEILGHRRYSLIGWSDGANVACIIASLHPQRVHRMLLCGGNAFMTSQDVEIMTSIRDLKTWDEDSLTPMLEEYGEEYFRKTWCAWVDHWVALLEEKGGKKIELLTEELTKIECETLVVHGDQDDLVPVSHGRYLKDHISNCRLLIWKNGGHDLHIKCSSKFNQTVEGFLQ